jgi:hypothetical protein
MHTNSDYRPGVSIRNPQSEIRNPRETMIAPDRQFPTCVVILFSIHFVLKAEKLFKQYGVSHDVIPVPRAISSDCGMAVEFPCADKDRATALLAAADIRIAGLYRREGNSFYTVALA